MESTIRVTRKAEFCYAARQLAVMVDGERIGFVGNGKTESFQIPPGRHEIWVSLDWCRSPACVIETPAAVPIEMEANIRGGLVGALITGPFTPKSYYELRVTPHGSGQYYRPL